VLRVTDSRSGGARVCDVCDPQHSENSRHPNSFTLHRLISPSPFNQPRSCESQTRSPGTSPTFIHARRSEPHWSLDIFGRARRSARAAGVWTLFRQDEDLCCKSQRDFVPKLKVARNEQPWVNSPPKKTTPTWVAIIENPNSCLSPCQLFIFTWFSPQKIDVLSFETTRIHRWSGESSPAVSPAAWTATSGAVNNSVTVPIPTGGESRFYRLKK